MSSESGEGVGSNGQWSGRIPALDGVRGIAILCVLAVHSGGLLISVAIQASPRGLAERVLAHPLLRTFGKYSYAIYLVHLMLVKPIVIETATGARRQPLMYAVTTAGNDPTGVCFQFHDYTEKILNGVVKDDAFFGMIYTLDIDEETGQREDWEDDSIWIKSNPNLRVSKKLSGIQDKAKRPGKCRPG